MKNLIVENMDKLKKINLPNFKSNKKIMVLDVFCPYSTDVISFNNIENYSESMLGMHGNFAGQVIQFVAGKDIEFYGCAYDLDSCINYCIENNIKIISSSINFNYSDKKEELLRKFYDFGGIFITTSGNNDGSSVNYPGSSKYTICVSATNSSDCDGSEIDITTDSNWYVRNKNEGYYHIFNGTSAAAPVISGCVALILEKYPNWNMEQVTKFLYDNSTVESKYLEEYEREFKFPDNFTLQEVNMFDDIKGHWAQEDIEFCVSEGLINGFEDGTFRPDEPLTRAQYCHILKKMLEGVINVI